MLALNGSTFDTVLCLLVIDDCRNTSWLLLCFRFSSWFAKDRACCNRSTCSWLTLSFSWCEVIMFYFALLTWSRVFWLLVVTFILLSNVYIVCVQPLTWFSVHQRLGVSCNRNISCWVLCFSFWFTVPCLPKDAAHTAIEHLYLVYLVFFRIWGDNQLVLCCCFNLI